MHLVKKLAVTLATATTLALAATPAMADYPSKPIKILVGFSAGGPIYEWLTSIHR